YGQCRVAALRPAVRRAEDPVAELCAFLRGPARRRGLFERLCGGKSAPIGYNPGTSYLTGRNAHSARPRTDCELRLGGFEQLAQNVGKHRAIAAHADESAYHDPPSHMLWPEHDRPPVNLDTRLVPPR